MHFLQNYDPLYISHCAFISASLIKISDTEILIICMQPVTYFVVMTLTLLHSEWPKLNRVLAVMSAVGLNIGE